LPEAIEIQENERRHTTKTRTEAYIAGLLEERKGAENKNDTQAVKDIDAELSRVGGSPPAARAQKRA
jgi:hypothetical protein